MICLLYMTCIAVASYGPISMPYIVQTTIYDLYHYTLWPVWQWVFYELIRFKIQNFPSPSCNMLLCPICSMGSMAARICIYDSYLLILWHVYSINCNIWPSMTLYYCLLWPICQCDCYLLSLLVSMLKKYCFQLVHPPCFSFLWCFFFKILILASYASIYRILCSRRTRWMMKTMRTRYR